MQLKKPSDYNVNERFLAEQHWLFLRRQGLGGFARSHVAAQAWPGLSWPDHAAKAYGTARTRRYRNIAFHMALLV